MKHFKIKKIWIYQTVLVAVLSTFTIGCKKDQLESIELITLPAHSIAETRASVECVVKNGTGRTMIQYGICWNTIPEPTIETGTMYWSHTSDEEDGFTTQLGGLFPSTTIYARVVAFYDGIAIYGNVISFETKGGTIGTVTDIDGNVYHTVIIGEQIWMVENLKTKRYRNGNQIPNVSSVNQWTTLTTGAFCYYNNDLNNAQTYGNLYNWYAVNDSRNIAPEGWHVATDDDWNTLVTYWIQLANSTFISSILREESGEFWLGWNNQCGASTNESNFTALPGGKLDKNEFDELTRIGYWWSSTAYYPAYPYYWSINCGSHVSRGNNQKTTGFSVRCVKD